MEIIIKGESDEIAALVLAVQGRQVVNVTSQHSSKENREDLVAQIKTILLEQIEQTDSADTQPPQPGSIERTPYPVAESHPAEPDHVSE